MNKTIIKNLQMQGRLSAFDVHFARFIDHYAAGPDADLGLAAALLSHATAQGDICLDLETTAGQHLMDRQDEQLAVVCPQLEEWLEKLKASPAVGSPGEIRPLILDTHHRLYLYRYWEYEQTIVNSIKRRIEKPLPDLDVEHLKMILERLFPKTKPQTMDWQKIAAAVACLKHFCVITGGPGTGKTFTVSKVLALLLELFADQQLKIYLAAPTGKAAARLQDTLEQARDRVNCAETVKSAFPSQVFTIHRMLKPIKGSPYFHFDAENPLLADAVIVDEASMVDLALMAKLLRAVPEKARLIIIGDKDQLASVEAGSVLGDICDRDSMHSFSAPFKNQLAELTGENLDPIVPAAKVEYGLQDSIVVLPKSYRFDSASGIGALSRAVNQGDADAALDILDNAAEKSLVWRRLKSDAHLKEVLSEQIVGAYRPYLTARDPAEALRLLENFKILCALNIGPWGVQAINRLAEQVLSRHHLIQPDPNADNPWYAGRPVLITRNHYPLGLFNGDIGTTLPPAGAAQGELGVYFRAPEGGVRRFLPHQLPIHETVYAMTVHKSQGSEFDDVLLIMPNKDVPLLNRELVYTALTRARRKITIWGTPDILRGAVTRKIQRTSGLRDALWGE
ncbi:MAG: exodeoxyribonuclease V subunit alpha [Desulfobacterales bacterium]|jgi:exodeoxyribonuclease V alpha subunit